MIEIFSLWLLIVLSSIFVFIISSIIHMALPWHKSDYPKLPMEDKFIDALRPYSRAFVGTYNHTSVFPAFI